MTEENYPLYILEFEKTIGNFFRIMKERHVNDAASINMSMPQFFCLFVISKVGQFKMSDLADHMSLSYASATNLVNRLSDAGLVKRFDSPDDRRVVVVELSEKGKELMAGIRSKHLNHLTKKCENLSEEDISTMI